MTLADEFRDAFAEASIEVDAERFAGAERYTPPPTSSLRLEARSPATPSKRTSTWLPAR